MQIPYNHIDLLTQLGSLSLVGLRLFLVEVNVTIFLSMGKMRKKPDKPLTADATERIEGLKQRGITGIGP